jgi:hypothetical protein
MKKLWLTYAWKDNEDKDVDFIIQELEQKSIRVKFDRRNLIAGQRLWDQIGRHISDPGECDALGIICTPNSLASSACMEELYYALDRALTAREDGFPSIALLHRLSFPDLPPALKTRLCISLRETDWPDRVVASVKRQPMGFAPESHSPFLFKEYLVGDALYVEVRPRLSAITPFIVIIDYSGVESECIEFLHGHAGAPPLAGLVNGIAGQKVNVNSPDGPIAGWGSLICNTPATPQYSYYLKCKSRPKRIWCGDPSNLHVQSLA